MESETPRRGTGVLDRENNSTRRLHSTVPDGRFFQLTYRASCDPPLVLKKRFSLTTTNTTTSP